MSKYLILLNRVMFLKGLNEKESLFLMVSINYCIANDKSLSIFMWRTKGDLCAVLCGCIVKADVKNVHKYK